MLKLTRQWVAIIGLFRLIRFFDGQVNLKTKEHFSMLSGPEAKESPGFFELVAFALWFSADRRMQNTMIHSGTLCIQRKVTKFPCFGGLVFRAQFQHFLWAFWRSFFAMQLALVSMITITPTLSLSVFSLQRTRLFRTCGELWRTRGELWLYFEMQRRLDLWSFSWSSRRSREAQKWAWLAFRDRPIDYGTDPRR